MDYKKQHDLIIERARGRLLEGYSERHHIIPRCMGGSDDADNLVDLTPEEHYTVHQLLAQIYKGTEHYANLIYAVNMMTVSNSRVNRSMNKAYGWVRRECARLQSERMNGQTWNRGKIRTPEMKAHLSKINLENPSRGHLGKTHSTETKKLWSEKRQGRKWIYKDNNETQIDKNKIQEYLEEGWQLGRRPGVIKSESNAYFGKKGKEHPVYGFKHSEEECVKRKERGKTLYIKEPERRFEVSQRMAKDWIIIDPNKNQLIVRNLTQFCQERNVPYVRIRKSLGGWKCLRI